MSNGTNSCVQKTLNTVRWTVTGELNALCPVRKSKMRHLFRSCNAVPGFGLEKTEYLFNKKATVSLYRKIVYSALNTLSYLHCKSPINVIHTAWK